MLKERPSIFISILTVCVFIIIIPTFIVGRTKTLQEKTEQHPLDNAFTLNFPEKKGEKVMEVSVFRKEKNKIEKLPIENYVFGVVAGEMPADFELEALKAQAVAARTYIVRAFEKNPKQNKYLVEDTVQDQVYLDMQTLKKNWGKDFKEKSEKIKEAIADTQGQIITYKKEPITALFFSTSNGKTEDAERYWANSVPYLKSVQSKWDKSSPKFNRTQTFSKNEVEKKLGVKLRSSGYVLANIKRTPSGRIEAVTISGKRFTGREVREKLGLYSNHFSMLVKNNEVVCESYGFGHGVGMSQYGANGMAKENYRYEQIIKHYYRGVAITDYRNVVKI